MQVILFDGVCNLCNGFVNWIIDHDPKAIFHFASLQSDFGKALSAQHQLNEESLNTVVYLDEDKVYIRSEAVLRIAKKMGGLYSLFFACIFAPRFLRDGVYNFVARHRYKWFGKSDICRVPDVEIKNRFL